MTLRRLQLLAIFGEALIALVGARLRLKRKRPLACVGAGRASFRVSSSASPARIAWAVNRAAAFVPRATCLVRAIAAQHLLARRGYSADVHIGVANSEAAGFEAHAWVECNGDILVGRTDTRYTPLLNWRAAQ